MINFYESNAHFYSSLAFPTNTLMEYLRVSDGWTVKVVFPRIHKWIHSWLEFTEATYLREKSGSKILLKTGLIHMSLSLHLILWDLSHSFHPTDCLSIFFVRIGRRSNSWFLFWIWSEELLSRWRPARYWGLVGPAQLPANTIIRRYLGHSDGMLEITIFSQRNWSRFESDFETIATKRNLNGTPRLQFKKLPR